MLNIHRRMKVKYQRKTEHNQDPAPYQKCTRGSKPNIKSLSLGKPKNHPDVNGPPRVTIVQIKGLDLPRTLLLFAIYLQIFSEIPSKIRYRMQDPVENEQSSLKRNRNVVIQKILHDRSTTEILL